MLDFNNAMHEEKEGVSQQLIIHKTLSKAHSFYHLAIGFG
jgi:hypothetical protein